MISSGRVALRRAEAWLWGSTRRSPLGALLVSGEAQRPGRARMATGPETGPDDIIVTAEEMKRFMVDCMTSVGTEIHHALQLADVLLAGDTRGHYSHGLNRLEMYVNDIAKGVCKGKGTPSVLKERPATAWVDGNNLLGPVVGNFCTDLAIRKAKEAGVGWVVAKGSNHYGIAGWYTLRAMEQGLLGLSFTNTSPLTFPTRARKAAIGTNPLSLAAPGKDSDGFVLDMATTTVAVGKIELADRKGQPIPDGWGVNKEGRTTSDAKDVLKGGGLMPLGGAELTGGYKGFGLAMMVEIFCGILGGAAFGPKIRRWMDTKGDANLGQCFIAVDPDSFAPDFSERLEHFMELIRGLPPVDSEHPVLVAGDPERRHEKLCVRLGGIPYHPKQIAHAEGLAKRLGVRAPLPK